MLPDSATAIWVAFLAVVPGYVAVSTFAGRQKTWRGSDTDLRTILQALWVSAIVQIVAAPVTLIAIYPDRSHLDQHPVRVAVWALLVVFVIPWMGARAFALISIRSGIGGGIFWAVFTAPAAPSAWDRLFAASPPDGSFVIVEFTDGKQVGGSFSIGSFAITSPEARGLFLAEEWALDANGNLLQAVPGSRGILILDVSEVRSLRVLR
jgi:hypothetical protein